MQIVIDIPEEEYEDIINSEDCGLHRLTRAIANGTPLPKGHGDLTDKDILAKRMIEYGWHHPDSTVHEFIEDDLPAIIEADKEKEE